MTRIPVLMYHSVDDSPAAACVTPKRFEEQIAYLSRVGYRAADLDSVYRYMAEGGPIPQKPVVITFDDGYRDNLEKAYPILTKYAMCATIFLTTDYMGNTNLWNVKNGVTQRPIMSWREVREAARDSILSFQAHTCSHPKLTRIPLRNVKEEVLGSKEVIEDCLGKACYHFAYPYGDFNESVRNVVSEIGYRTACSVRWGHNRRGDDLLSLFRIGVRNEDRLSDFKRVLGETPLWKYYWLRLRTRLAQNLGQA